MCWDQHLFSQNESALASAVNNQLCPTVRTTVKKRSLSQATDELFGHLFGVFCIHELTLPPIPSTTDRAASATEAQEVKHSRSDHRVYESSLESTCQNLAHIFLQVRSAEPAISLRLEGFVFATWIRCNLETTRFPDITFQIPLNNEV